MVTTRRGNAMSSESLASRVSSRTSSRVPKPTEKTKALKKKVEPLRAKRGEKKQPKSGSKVEETSSRRATRENKKESKLELLDVKKPKSSEDSVSSSGENEKAENEPEKRLSRRIKSKDNGKELASRSILEVEPKVTSTKSKGKKNADFEPKPATRVTKSKDKNKGTEKIETGKVPIYLQKMDPPSVERENHLGLFNLKKRKTSLIKEKDIYNLNAYGEEEFGLQPDKKRKCRKRPKRQPGDIILTFGQTREKVAPILKELKNLKTPQAVAPKKNQEEQCQPLKKVEQTSPLSRPRPPSFSVQDSPTGDSFLPITDSDDIQHHQVESHSGFEAPKQLDKSTNSFTKLRKTSCTQKQSPDSICFLSKNGSKNKYKTPMIPRHVSKKEGKVSTPRPEEKAKAMTTQELVKISFGFESSDEMDEDEGESLLDFSGISHRGGVQGHFQSSTFISPTSNLSRLSNIGKPQNMSKNPPETVVPYRFDLFLPKATSTFFTLPSKITSNTGYVSLSCTDKKNVVNSSKVLKQNVFVPNFEGHQQQIFNNNKGSNSSDDIENEVDDGIDPNKTSGSSLFGTVEDENEQQGLAGGEEPVECDMDEKVVDYLKEQDDEVIKKKEKKNVFAIMKGATGKENVKGVKRSRNMQPTKLKKVKQTSIKEALQIAENRKTESKKKNVLLEEGKRNQEKLTRTYAERAPFDSTLASNTSSKHHFPVRKDAKKEKEINDWASLTTSHFSEVEDFDLSFV